MAIFSCIYLDNKISTLTFFCARSPLYSSIKREDRVLSRYLKIKLCHFATARSLRQLVFHYESEQEAKGMKMLP